MELIILQIQQLAHLLSYQEFTQVIHMSSNV